MNENVSYLQEPKQHDRMMTTLELCKTSTIELGCLKKQST